MTILPACIFPNVEWMVHFVNPQLVLIDGFEFYQRKTYRNRFDILGPNGRQTLSVPVSSAKGSKCPVNEAHIEPGKWQREHWNALKTAYNSSPFFEHYEDVFKPLFENPPARLIDFFDNGLKTVFSLLELPIEIKYTSEYWNEECRIDFRHKVKGSRQFDEIRYPQIFEDRFGFVDNLSVLDLLFNTGPEARILLSSRNQKPETS